jgi:hypothetical protein
VKAPCHEAVGSSRARELGSEGGRFEVKALDLREEGERKHSGAGQPAAEGGGQRDNGQGSAWQLGGRGQWWMPHRNVWR